MKLKSLTELAWRLYQNGRAYANDQHILKADFQQKLKVSFADAMRQRYYESKKMDEFGSPDYSFSSPLLNVKRYPLAEANGRRKRRCDMDIDIYRLPKNSHFTNVYPVAEGCDMEDLDEITQVKPGEENFYISDPSFNSIYFYVVKGKGIDTYNLPECVNHLDIETTYDLDDETEIEDGIGSLVIDQILNVTLGIRKQYYSKEVQDQMQDQNIVK